MVFGDGSEGMPFALGSDVIAHEFTHRIISRNGGIEYAGESGAINESLADTMAAALDEDWIVGEDVVEDGIRDMSRKVTMDDFVVTDSDHGGVHTNSAIPNHAAYLIGEEVGRDKMGAIYARTIDEHISNDMDFRDLARGTWQAATELYGANSAEARAVKQAWEGVLLVEDGSLWSDGGGFGGGNAGGGPVGSGGGGGAGGSF
jgi:Zn-dependent metalloprotease